MYDHRPSAREWIEKARQIQARIRAFVRAYAEDTFAGVKDRLQESETRPVTIGLLGVVGALFVFLMYWVFLISQIPNVHRLDVQKLSEATIAYTSDGEELTRYAIENRTWVDIDEISPSAVDALIATEDRRFYRHNGIDLLRFFGAVIGTAAGDPQGGSTLTMQLAKNMYPSIRTAWIGNRKMKEWLTALRLEDRFTKEEILELYFNAVPLMYGAVGIEAGARTYFQKPASDLNVLESATLVAMLKATVFYNPVRNPERSHQRRNVVLQQMVKAGSLTADEYEALRDQKTEVRFRRLTRHENTAPFFAEHVRQWLDVWAASKGYNLYTDGLRVYTTLDSRLQHAAETATDRVGDYLQDVVDVEWSASEPFFASDAQAYREAREKIEPFAFYWEENPSVMQSLIRMSSRYRDLVDEGVEPDSVLGRLRTEKAFTDSLKQGYQRLEVGFVAVEPETGHVKSWVGGRDFRIDEYDHVGLAKRQPGSTFKPFVYAAALENGYAPFSMVSDGQMTYVDPHTGQRWSPKNFGGSSGGLISLRNGLAHSKNTVTARLITDVGPRKVVDIAHRMGIRSPLEAVPSLGLGTSDVSLLELTSAYATFANLGVRKDPIFITRIEDRQGRVIARFGSRPVHAIPPHTAYAVLDMMRSVVGYGTGVRIRSLFGAKGDLAGKTGTTQKSADGWFMLVHPKLVMGSWVGFNNPAVTFRTAYWGQGAHTALHVVGEFYREAGRVRPGALNPSLVFKQAPPYTWRGGSAATADALTRREREKNNLGEALKKIRESRGESAETPPSPSP